MKKKAVHYCIILTAHLLVANTGAFAGISAYEMRTENHRNAEGIQVRSPRFSWKIFSHQRGFTQSAYEIRLADCYKRMSSENGELLWSSGKVESGESVLVGCPDLELSPSKVYYWCVRVWNSLGDVSQWSLPVRFSTGLFESEDWSGAQWISMENDSIWPRIVPGIHAPLVDSQIGDLKTGCYQMPQFRKTFAVDTDVERAVLYISGLGSFESFINGRKVGDNFLDPGWTGYDSHALYITYDVTAQINEGNNVLGVMLGNGFYNIIRETLFQTDIPIWCFERVCQQQVDYKDGSRQNIISGPDWKTIPSPITYSSIYGGEDYDATLEKEGWLLNS